MKTEEGVFVTKYPTRFSGWDGGMGCGCKPASRIIQEEAQAYHASNSNPVKQLIADWEVEIS